MAADSTANRFWAKVTLGTKDECWLWTGCIQTRGYGQFRGYQSKHIPAHRFAYEALVGEIPEGLVIDHLCRVRRCVNPAHMEIVTQRENILRGDGVAAHHARKTHCIRGHEFTPENTIRHPHGRNCRACRSAA